jgi:hypothetical protein
MQMQLYFFSQYHQICEMVKVGTISNVSVMEIGWTDVGSGGYILVSCAHSNTSLDLFISLLTYIQHVPIHITKFVKYIKYVF